MLCHRERNMKPTAFSRKGGTQDYFLATVCVGGISILPGAAEIHSAGTETRERSLTKFVYSRLIGLCLPLRTAWLCESKDSLITD